MEQPEKKLLVFRFCLKPQNWLFIPVSENLASSRSVKLARYEGKIGIVSLRSREGMNYDEIWVFGMIFCKFMDTYEKRLKI